MRIAALDLGSNSFHLLVADVHVDGTFTAVAREKEMLRLGDDVARHGRIPPATADRAIAAVRRLRQLADALGAREFIAKATSAIRTAANGPELIDRIESETGVEVEVINGDEEARLVFAAIRASVVLEPPPALCFDLGGGSVEIMIGDASGLRWERSLPLGVGRLTAECVHDDPPSRADRKRLDERVRAGLEPLVDEVRKRSPGLGVGTSGTLNDLVRMAVALESGERTLPASTNALRASRSAVEQLHERIMEAKTSERRRMPGLEEQRRAELLPAGSTLLVTALELFDLDGLMVSDWALREGIVLDAVRSHDPSDWSDDPRALRRASVASLARRCNSDVAHTDHVARLARRLFDQTVDLHGLEDRDREMLEFAALLHDIGQHVSRKGHHRHAAYLVENGELRGFEPAEVAFLATLVRHHRRGDPKTSESRYAALTADDRTRLRKLAAMLRVADGLDRGRRGGVEDLEAFVGTDLVVIRLLARDDAELELWGARRRRELFEKVFARELELVVGGSRVPADV
ncbi:MAG: exopolyphosphatase / guanosine-5-triphosphate,3-diphosphate pyrophosphatase [Actinomycetota bacterium]|jgi:exopolyphosphatase/guanosine-5'-triphosphate,3'-diphosphate pyrophosphatase|nr:exopolyphosphatase / guanosine-5-triphosphate,3-diphosphate pyrophosphatase [Actinomycetota bacterium]